MTQAELDREVSRVTGESMRRVRRQGFSILPLSDDACDDEPDVGIIRMIDWDAQDAIRRRAA
jgi:hypothetical protein